MNDALLQTAKELAQSRPLGGDYDTLSDWSREAAILLLRLVKEYTTVETDDML